MNGNPMREISIEKVTVNIGVGSPGERLDNAKELLRRLTERTPVETMARRREPAFKIRPGMPIGVKVTLRGKEAGAFLEKALAARKRVLSEKNFDKEGNFSFGIAEYIDFPGAKYDPSMGMYGFDVCVTLKRRGRRVAVRKLRNAKVGKAHRITKDEAIGFVKSAFNARVE